MPKVLIAPGTRSRRETFYAWQTGETFVGAVTGMNVTEDDYPVGSKVILLYARQQKHVTVYHGEKGWETA